MAETNCRKEEEQFIRIAKVSPVGDRDFDIQFRIHIEENDAAAEFVKLLNSGFIEWNIVQSKLMQVISMCEVCNKTAPVIQGKIDVSMDVKRCHTCEDCNGNLTDMKTPDVFMTDHATTTNDQDAMVKFPAMEMSVEEKEVVGGENEYSVTLNEIDNDRKDTQLNTLQSWTRSSTYVPGDLPYKRVQLAHDDEKVIVRYECQICKARTTRKPTILEHLKIEHQWDEPSHFSPIFGGDKSKENGGGPAKKTKIIFIRNSKKSSGNKEVNEYFHCSVCDKLFDSESILTEHMKTHPMGQPFKCKICDKLYLTEYHLEHHLKNEHEHIFRCLDCGRQFNHAIQLNDHEHIHDGRPLYQCIVCDACYSDPSCYAEHVKTHAAIKYDCTRCDKTFSTPKGLKYHQASHSDKRPFACDTCPLTFATSARLKRHVKIHSGVKDFLCEMCDRSFYEKYDLKKHLESCHSKIDFLCEICQKQFKTLKGLEQHSEMHSTTNEFICENCGKQFPSHRKLKAHAICHNEKDAFMCNTCGKGFHTKHSLRSHTLTHEGWKPHECDICGRKYRCLRHMKVHRKIHTGEDLIQCKYCGDRFVDPSYVKVHQKKYCKAKSPVVICEICNQGFSSQVTLKKHTGLHTGERPFGCQVCGLAFVTNFQLQDHMRRHTDTRDHKCSTCGKGFMRPKELRDHEKRHTREMKRMILSDDLKHGLVGNVEQHALESVVATEEVEGGIKLEMAHDGEKRIILSTIDQAELLQTHGLTFSDADIEYPVANTVVVGNENIILQMKSPTHSGQTIENVQVKNKIVILKR